MQRLHRVVTKSILPIIVKGLQWCWSNQRILTYFLGASKTSCLTCLDSAANFELTTVLLAWWNPNQSNKTSVCCDYFQLWRNSVFSGLNPMTNLERKDRKRLKDGQRCNTRLKIFCPGREPWSSGYGKRLTFQRSWVWILAPYTGWTFFLMCLL